MARLLIVLTVLFLLALLLVSCQADGETTAAGETATAPSTSTPAPSPTPAATATRSASPTPRPTAKASAASGEAEAPEPAATEAVTAESGTPAAAFLPQTASFELLQEEPIVPHGEPGAWDGQYTDPGAAVYHDGLYHLLHNGFTGWPAPVGVAYSTSPDGYVWSRVQEEPVFVGDDLDYVGLTALASSVLVEPDGTWVLYFYTWDGPTWPDAPSRIGRATAPDPLGPWRADPEPVLQPGPEGAWDALAVRAPSVVRTGEGYLMYYTGYDGRQGMIGMATSPDGRQWTKFDDPATTEAGFAGSDPVFRPGPDGAWDAGHVVQPRVVQSPDGLVMLYSGVPRLNVTNTLGYAVSQDGVNWQRAPEPVLDYSVVPGGRAIWFTELLYQDGAYFLFFELGTGGQTEVYLATHEGSLLESGGG